jgi:alkanesulfonate monooxygenase SsuD/methylene tetrahydromethanopterin reductase-like flavin-dependent oxidoreductase (luciferase family)
VPRILVGTAVVPMYPRHPVVLASQAKAAQLAAGGRFALGIGLGHQG